MTKLTMRQLRKKIRQREIAIAAKKTLLQQQLHVIKNNIMLPALVIAAISGGLLMRFFLQRKSTSKKNLPSKSKEKPTAVKISRINALMAMLITATTFISTLLSAKEKFNPILKHIFLRKPPAARKTD